MCSVSNTVMLRRRVFLVAAAGARLFSYLLVFFRHLNVVHSIAAAVS